MIIKVLDYAGDFGENKDIAKQLRLEKILPSLEKNKEITIDFTGVSGVTQSFIHALISDPIRKYPETVFDKIIFKNCSDNVRVVVEIVERYMQESLA